jgi:hypothetical protein
MTKDQRRRLAEYNAERRRMGLQPVDTLKAMTIDRTKMKTSNKVPDYGARLRHDSTRNIPSLSHRVSPDATARDTMMERALAGKEAPAVAAEIIRKGQCLAPAYSKGAYTYIGSTDQALDVGRKK